MIGAESAPAVDRPTAISILIVDDEEKVRALCRDVIADAIRKTPAKKYIAYYESVLQQNAERKATRSAAKKTAVKAKPAKKAKT